jgi:hypothetical protein
MKLRSLILCIFSLYARPVIGMNDSIGQKYEPHKAWKPSYHHNYNRWPYSHSARPAWGPFTQEQAWDFIKRINCQHHWSCPHYHSYSYGMYQGKPHCRPGLCTRYYTPVHHGDEHIGKIFAVGSVIMAINLYYLYKDLFPDRPPIKPDDRECTETVEEVEAVVTV